MSEDPIVFTNLRRTFGDFVAVDDLSLTIKKNSFTGLLGPNGAGKSTSLKVLTNLIRPTSGSVEINGFNVTKTPKLALEGVGTVVETPEFYLYLTPNETFSYIGSILGMNHESIVSETQDILAKVKMTEWADKRLGTFSKGMRQRVALGQSMLNSPGIIILDEPTSGLDPRGMAEIREILKDLRNDKNLTVLMSSHMLHEVSDLCDRVAMINHGKLLVHDTIESVTSQKGVRNITIKLVGGPSDDAVSKISKLQNVLNAEIFGSEIEVKVEGGDEEQMKLLKDIYALGLDMFSFSENGNSLEASYLSLIKESR